MYVMNSSFSIWIVANIVQREQEQRENLAQTLRALRTEANRSTITIERLEARNEDLARQLATSQSQERLAKAALRTAEASARTLREEMAKLKGTVQQIRASCANDVRKRDVQIQRLKSHLTEQQRGNKTGLVGASITISPGLNLPKKDEDQKLDPNPDINDPAYSLKQETTEFLTQLSQSLSDENDNLIGLVRGALATLKELQGLPANAQRAGDAGAQIDADDTESDSQMLQVLPTSYQSLSKDMEHVLENLKTILTNPNYVPIEEVARREDEIMRLREGWEKMEARWREAIQLMDGWRTRMLNGGDTINLEEIKIGLGLAEGIATGTRTTRTSDSTTSALDERSEELEEGASLECELNDSSAFQNDLDAALDKMQEVKATNARAVKPADALREADGNRRSPRKVTFEAEPATDENASEVDLIPTSSVVAATKPPKSTYRFHPPTNPSERKKPSDRSRDQDSTRKTTKTRVRFTSSVIARTPHADASISAHQHPHSGAGAASNPARSIIAPPQAEPQPNDPIKRRLSEPFSPLSPSKFNLPANPNFPDRLPLLTYIYIDPLQSLKRLSSPSPLADERATKLTVQEKLNVAQAEAEAAAVAAGLRLDDIVVGFEEGFGAGCGIKDRKEKEKEGKQKDGPGVGVGGKSGSPRVRKMGVKGRPKRRKSTLTPEELEALMFN